MATCKASGPARNIFSELRSSSRNVSRSFIRTLTTETPQTALSQAHADAQLSSTPTGPVLNDQMSASQLPGVNSLQYKPPANPFITAVACTTYAFPSFEPRHLVTYPSTHLLLPLRKDILHRAVVFEDDSHKQGTANTKWRSEVRGSSKKVRPQKGSGMARLGDKKSPMLRGGGVAFGPKPRSFATDLPKKIYDLAFRTALSHRYKQGELLVLDAVADIDVDPASAARYLRDVLQHNDMGKGRSIFVTFERRTGLFQAIEDKDIANNARGTTVRDVEVKELLKSGRILMERNALEWLLQQHEDDLPPTSRLERWTQAHRQYLCKKSPSEALSDLLGK